MQELIRLVYIIYYTSPGIITIIISNRYYPDIIKQHRACLRPRALTTPAPRHPLPSLALSPLLAGSPYALFQFKQERHSLRSPALNTSLTVLTVYFHSENMGVFALQKKSPLSSVKCVRTVRNHSLH